MPPPMRRDSGLLRARLAVWESRSWSNQSRESLRFGGGSFVPLTCMPSKRYKKALELVAGHKLYRLKSAVEVLTKFPKAKFNESIDMAFKLGVDPKQSDQMVRGTVPLPHGSGKVVRVLVFAKPGAAADAARAAGAEYVGFDDLIKQCNEGWTDFD